METITFIIPGYNGNESQCDALEAYLREAGVEGDVVPLLHLFHGRPYRSPEEIIKAAAEQINDEDPFFNDQLEICLVGLSMGGQIAVRVYQQLVDWQVNRDQVRVIAIDSPYDARHITGWQSTVSRALGSIAIGHRFSRDTAQAVAIATMMHGFTPKGINSRRIDMVSLDSNTDIIQSDDARLRWQDMLPGVNMHVIEGKHGYLSPDIMEAKPGEEDLLKLTQANLQAALTKIVKNW